MANYEIPDYVKKNILNLIHRVQIQGSEWPALAEIEHVLSEPVKDKKDEIVHTTG